jgi:hypothetical protein
MLSAPSKCSHSAEDGYQYLFRLVWVGRQIDLRRIMRIKRNTIDYSLPYLAKENLSVSACSHTTQYPGFCWLMSSKGNTRYHRSVNEALGGNGAGLMGPSCGETGLVSRDKPDIVASYKRKASISCHYLCVRPMSQANRKQFCFIVSNWDNIVHDQVSLTRLRCTLYVNLTISRIGWLSNTIFSCLYRLLVVHWDQRT